MSFVNYLNESTVFKPQTFKDNESPYHKMFIDYIIKPHNVVDKITKRISDITDANIEEKDIFFKLYEANKKGELVIGGCIIEYDDSENKYKVVDFDAIVTVKAIKHIELIGDIGEADNFNDASLIASNKFGAIPVSKL